MEASVRERMSRQLVMLLIEFFSGVIIMLVGVLLEVRQI